MSKRESVKRKPILLEDSKQDLKEDIHVNIIPVMVLNQQGLVNSTNSEIPSRIDIGTVKKPIDQISLAESTKLSRKPTISSLDEDSVSIESKKFNIGIKTPKRHRNLLKDYKRQSTVELVKHSRLNIVRAVNEKKIDSDEIWKLKQELIYKTNELEKLKSDTKFIDSTEFCALKDYKKSILILNEMRKYNENPLEKHQEIDQIVSYFQNESDSTINTLLAEEFNAKLDKVYLILKKVIYKNLVLNKQLQEVGLCIPNVLIDKIDLKSFMEIHEQLLLTVNQSSPESLETSQVDINDLESKLQDQISQLSIDKWEREGTKREIETHFHDKFIDIINELGHKHTTIDKASTQMDSPFVQNATRTTNDSITTTCDTTTSDTIIDTISNTINISGRAMDNYKSKIKDSKEFLEAPILNVDLDIDFSEFGF